MSKVWSPTWIDWVPLTGSLNLKRPDLCWPRLLFLYIDIISPGHSISDREHVEWNCLFSSWCNNNSSEKRGSNREPVMSIAMIFSSVQHRNASVRRTIRKSSKKTRRKRRRNPSMVKNVKTICIDDCIKQVSILPSSLSSFDPLSLCSF